MPRLQNLPAGFPVLALLIAVACETTPARTSTSESRGSTNTATASVDVEIGSFQVRIQGRVVRHLMDLGWNDVMILSGARPEELTIWEAEDHLHARTDYVWKGGRIGLIQAEGQELTLGKAVQIRGIEGVRADGILYWVERKFVLSLSPGRLELTTRLDWVSASS